MSEGKLHYLFPENGRDKYYFEEIDINNRNSLAEHGLDHMVRQKFWHIHSGDIVFDVGAGFGSYTLCALARGAKFVYAFENNPIIARCLQANIYRNEDNIRAMSRFAFSKWRVDDNQHSLDKYISELSNSLNRISWIKIDTGDIASNINVLQGARKTIQKFKPNVLINAPSDAAAGLSEYGKILYNEEDGHRLVVFER